MQFVFVSFFLGLSSDQNFYLQDRICILLAFTLISDMTFKTEIVVHCLMTILGQRTDPLHVL